MDASDRTSIHSPLTHLTWRIHVLRKRPRPLRRAAGLRWSSAPADLWQPGALWRPCPLPWRSRPYGAPNQFGQFGLPPLTPDIAPLPGASFGEAIKRFFQRYAQFRGYASRSEFWWSYLFLVGSLFVLYLVFGVGIVALITNEASESSAGLS